MTEALERRIRVLEEREQIRVLQKAAFHRSVEESFVILPVMILAVLGGMFVLILYADMNATRSRRDALIPQATKEQQRKDWRTSTCYGDARFCSRPKD